MNKPLLVSGGGLVSATSLIFKRWYSDENARPLASGLLMCSSPAGM